MASYNSEWKKINRPSLAVGHVSEKTAIVETQRLVAVSAPETLLVQVHPFHLKTLKFYVFFQAKKPQSACSCSVPACVRPGRQFERTQRRIASSGQTDSRASCPDTLTPVSAAATSTLVHAETHATFPFRILILRPVN